MTYILFARDTESLEVVIAGSFKPRGTRGLLKLMAGQEQSH